MRFALVAATSWFTCSSLGGAEKQVYYLATAFARNGHHVDLYTMDIDESFFKDGVNVIPAWNRKAGIRFIRYFTHRIPRLGQKLRDGNYDLVYMRGYSEFSQSVVRTLRHSEAQSVIALASDKNLSWNMWKQSFPERNKWKDPQNWLMQYIFRRITLRYVSIIVTQNEIQSKLAKQYGKNIVYIPSIFRANIATEHAEMPKGGIAWIGGLRPEKGVNSLLTIIDALPEINFTVVGHAKGEIQKKYSQELISKSNVAYIKYLDNSHMHVLLSGMGLLLNTSPHEGFSNTFLEAWYAGTPVVSLVANPSNLLSDESLGWCADGNLNDLVRAIKKMMNDESKLNMYSKKAKDYVIQYHGENGIVSKFEKLVEEAEISG